MTHTAFSSFVSRRVQSVKLSPVAAATAQAAALAGEGRSIITLTSGEPDFDTPEAIKDAAIFALKQGDTKYTATAGTAALRNAIVAKYSKENNISLKTDHVIVSNGGKQVIYQALNATLNDSDQVIIPAPYWPSFPDMVKINGGVPVLIQGRASEGFKITAARLEQAITQHTKWLILNSPNNPTGAVYSISELKQLAEVLRRHPHVLILWDEMYEHIWFTDEAPVHFLHVAPDLKERTLLVNGASKTYAMTGWRIGWGAGPEGLIRAMGVVQSQVSSGANSFAQAATVAALNGVASDFVEIARLTYQKRASQVIEGLSRIPGLKVIRPEGSFFVYVNCEDLIGSLRPDGGQIQTDQDLVDWLLESQGVAVVAGTAYGLSPYFRLSFAASDQDLQQAILRIERARLQLTLSEVVVA